MCINPGERPSPKESIFHLSPLYVLALDCVTANWHQEQHQGYFKMHSYIRTIFSQIISSLYSSIHPPEIEADPPKTVCGCPSGGTVKTNGHTCGPLTLWNATVNVQLHFQRDPLSVQLGNVTTTRPFFFFFWNLSFRIPKEMNPWWWTTLFQWPLWPDDFLVLVMWANHFS